MVYLVLAATVVVSVLTVAVTVLVGRQRRRMDSGPEARRIEATASRGVRDARRLAHAQQHFNDAGGLSALRDRDSRS
ncbi:hypothetical protein [Streptomyces phaeochromogenes]|uniref:hypothetical protein n=1 Tax=Streptomyces phaeochromogenes TaxID=1923 RepID=UPI0012FEE2AF|nr:hypothetical protein [Streptomyces phaeochromogenes]